MQLAPDGIPVRGQFTSDSAPWSEVESVSERHSYGRLYPIDQARDKGLRPTVPSSSKRTRSPAFDEAMASPRLYAEQGTAEPSSSS